MKRQGSRFLPEKEETCGNMRSGSRTPTESQCEPLEDDEEILDIGNDNFPDTVPLRSGKKTIPHSINPKKEYIDDIEDESINLLGDKDNTSDASMAIRALLGEGGDFRAGSEIDEDQVRALLTLLDVAEELNSPRLLKTAENFLLLRISAGGKGRTQVVGAFRGLYEPSAQPQQMQGGQPSGYLRGDRQ